MRRTVTRRQPRAGKTGALPKKTGRQRIAKRPSSPPTQTDQEALTIEPLDPWLLCGPDTTVQELWRVTERVGTHKVFHLVFFDRYGWYCEHGQTCLAVPKVRNASRMLSHLIRELERAPPSRPRKQTRRKSGQHK